MGDDDKARLGLAERRALKRYQDEILPEIETRIFDAATFEFPIEIDWESIARPAEADRYAEPDYWTNVFFEPLIESLQSITADEMGTEALTENLKKLVIHCDDQAPASNYLEGLSLEEGTLAINWRPYTNAHARNERTQVLTKFLESRL